jgi:hypothetical protein
MSFKRRETGKCATNYRRIPIHVTFLGFLTVMPIYWQTVYSRPGLPPSVDRSEKGKVQAFCCSSVPCYTTPPPREPTSGRKERATPPASIGNASWSTYRSTFDLSPLSPASQRLKTSSLLRSYESLLWPIHTFGFPFLFRVFSSTCFWSLNILYVIWLLFSLHSSFLLY